KAAAEAAKKEAEKAAAGKATA
ncbi:MAG: hypothetical protein QG575_2150, partial [Euryarchaeota archaeon]|nr:hypothetical protein [Euryarchaeota archaeon]